MKTLLYLWRLFMLLVLPSWVMAQANAPTNLTTTSVAYNRVALSWRDNTNNESKFEIERNSFAGFVKIGEAGVNGMSFVDNNVQPNGTYTYRVRAVLVTGANTLYSNELTVATPTEPPGVPTGLTVQYQNGRMSITWNNGSGGTPVDYRLERGSTSGGPFSLLQTVVYSRTPSATDNGVSGGQQYCYRVQARNAGGTSGFTGPICATVPLLPTNIVNLRTTVLGSSSIRLNWNPYGKESPITIERRRGQSGNFEKIRDWLADSGEFTDTGLESGTEYCYRIGESGYEYSVVVCTSTQQSIPAAPARLQVQAVAYNQINLQWADLSSNETGFQIERADSPTGTFTKIRDVEFNTTTYSDQSVQGSTQYCYRVRAVNGVGSSNPTDVACVTTPAPPVGIPQNLRATAVSTTQISLTWGAVAGASGYQLERSPNGTDSWTKVTDLTASTTDYVNGSLTPNTRYYYRIRALNAAGIPGDYSTIADAITPDVPPTAPARLTITAVSFNQVSLQWADLSGNESGFEIERSTDGTTWNKLVGLDPNSTQYDDKSVAPQTRYFYRIRAVNAAGPSNYAGPADATTPVGPPVAVQDLQATAISTTQISLTWGSIANAASIVIERSPDGSSNWSNLTTVAGTATGYVDEGLTPNTRYHYRLRASNASGTSPNSNVANAITPDVPPAAPARLTATPVSPTQVNLQWADLSNNESGFEVEQSNSATGTFTRIADLRDNITSYSVTGLTDNTQYCFRVRAKNAAGNSAFTDAVCTTTPLAPPTAPTTLRAELADYDQIRVSWPGLPTSVSTVIVERSTSPTGSFTQVAQAPANQGAYVDRGLAELTTYYYRIRAVNAAGASGNSNIASATTPEAIIGNEDPILAGATVFLADRQLVVRFDHTAPTTLSVHLLRLTGQSALTEHIRLGHTGQWTRSVDYLPTGVYVVVLESPERNARVGRKVYVP